jgi:hypothetical protein
VCVCVLEYVFVCVCVPYTPAAVSRAPTDSVTAAAVVVVCTYP